MKINPLESPMTNDTLKTQASTPKPGRGPLKKEFPKARSRPKSRPDSEGPTDRTLEDAPAPREEAAP